MQDTRLVALYPDLPAQRTRTIARDLLVLLLLIAFAWIALRVDHDLDHLAVLGTGVHQAGAGIGSGLNAAASATGNVPIVGGTMSSALRSAGSAVAHNLEAIGTSGAQSAQHVARLVGAITWALPTAFLLFLVLPARLRQIRALTEARRALTGPDADARAGLMALRAATTLPADALMAHTPDPAGDLLARRYDGLLAAALEDLGLRDPRAGATASAGRVPAGPTG
jgi:hypothetical protein